MKARLLQHSAVEERHASAASAASAAHATGPSAALFNSAALKFTSVGAAEVITKGVGGAGADEIVQHVRASKGAMIFDTLRRLVLRAQALAHEAASSAGDARITQKAKKVIGAGNFLAKAYNLQLSYLLLAELELDLGAAATESLSDKDNQKIDKHSVDSELLAQFAEVKISSKEHEIEQVLTTGLHKQIIDEEADLCRMLPLISAAAAVASTAASDVMTEAASALVE